jgi:hypothetical protein
MPNWLWRTVLRGPYGAISKSRKELSRVLIKNWLLKKSGYEKESVPGGLEMKDGSVHF